MSKCMDMMKYLAGIFLGFILTTIVPGKVVGLLNLNDYWIANIVGVLTMDIIMAAVIIGFGEKNVFAFSFKSFKKTFYELVKLMENHERKQFESFCEC